MFVHNYPQQSVVLLRGYSVAHEHLPWEGDAVQPGPSVDSERHAGAENGWKVRIVSSSDQSSTSPVT